MILELSEDEWVTVCAALSGARRDRDRCRALAQKLRAAVDSVRVLELAITEPEPESQRGHMPTVHLVEHRPEEPEPGEAARPAGFWAWVDRTLLG